MDFNTYNISLVYMTHWIILSSGKAPLLNHIWHCACPLVFVCILACSPLPFLRSHHPALWFLKKGVSEPSSRYTSSFLRCHWETKYRKTHRCHWGCVYVSLSALIEKNIISSNRTFFHWICNRCLTLLPKLYIIGCIFMQNISHFYSFTNMCFCCCCFLHCILM